MEWRYLNRGNGVYGDLATEYARKSKRKLRAFAHLAFHYYGAIVKIHHPFDDR
jgi:hypothetical protein